MTNASHDRPGVRAPLLSRILAWRFAAAVGAAGAAAGAEFVVAPDGSPDGTGTEARPFATLTQARDAVRALKKTGALPAEGIAIRLRAGTYALTETFSLSAEDGGTPAAPVVYRADPGAEVWVSGAAGLAPDRFSAVRDPAVLARLPAEARGHVLQADLKDADVPEDVPELPDSFSGFTGNDPLLLKVFCNGEWMTCARWPNEGFAKFDTIVDTGSGLRDYVAQREKRLRPGVFRYSGDRPSRWNTESGVWMLGYWARAYVCDIVRAGSIDTAKREIAWKGPLKYGLDTWGANRWFAFNLIEELDTPGEWYLDRAADRLYFWPPKPIAQCRVAVARLTDPMLVCDRVGNVAFEGIGFEGGRGDAVVVKGGSNVCLRACEIRNIGRHAVQLAGGKNHRVLGCDIHHAGHSGIVMSGGDRKTLDPAGFEAVNNHIYLTNRDKRTHASPVNMNGVGMRLAHNLIHHAPHSAVFYGGNDLIMEYNDIYWCHYETAEGGVFYAGYNWTYRGNEIRYNYIHHINDSLEGSPTDVRTVHLDDCVAGTTFRGNVVYRGGRGVAICGGPFNVVDNNLFIDCQVGAELETRGLAWWEWTRNADGTVSARDRRDSHAGASCGLLTTLNAVPWDREPYTKYPHMADILSVDDLGAPWWCAITRNISIGGEVLHADSRVKPGWADIGRNWNGPTDGDPGVRAPHAGGYDLKPDAPATARTGFEPIPFQKIGLLHDGTRRSWPVRAEPPPRDFVPAWIARRDLEKKLCIGVPVVPVRQAPAAVVVDGAISEWTSGEAYRPERLDETPAGSRVAASGTVWMGADEANLHLVFDNPSNPGSSLKVGRDWDTCDAVEVSVRPADAGVTNAGSAWRGYSDGHVETVGRVPAAQTPGGVRFACKVVSPGRWTAEMAIPYRALGIDPKARNVRLLCRLAVRRSGGDSPVMWRSAAGAPQDIRRDRILWLEPFGTVVLGGSAPSQGAVHVIGKTGSATPVLMKAVKDCEVAGWDKPAGGRLTAVTADLPADRWTPFSFSFVPESDGQVDLMIMGRGLRSPTGAGLVPVWTYTDGVAVEGADLVNGGFEAAGPGGAPAGWTPTGGSLTISDARVAAEGTRCIKTWHDGRMVQRIKVTGGRPVSFRCLVKGEPPAAP
jgi:hypothetical protein